MSGTSSSNSESESRVVEDDYSVVPNTVTTDANDSVEMTEKGVASQPPPRKESKERKSTA